MLDKDKERICRIIRAVYLMKEHLEVEGFTITNVIVQSGLLPVHCDSSSEYPFLLGLPVIFDDSAKGIRLGVQC